MRSEESDASSSVKQLGDSLFIVGRYNKLSRNLCQTPWIVDGQRKMESSVQEIIFEEIAPYFECESKFVSIIK